MIRILAVDDIAAGQCVAMEILRHTGRIFCGIAVGDVEVIGFGAEIVSFGRLHFHNVVGSVVRELIFSHG